MNNKNSKTITDKTPLKIILLGDVAVGKTNIILRYLKNEFNEHSISTIGTTFSVKQIVKNNIEYILNIWDTTGQEMYRAVTKLFIQGAKIVILVYSIEERKTFESLDYWYDTIKEICGENIIIAIVGNKTDLFEDLDETTIVPDEEGMEYAKKKNAIFKSVSAKKDRKGIISLFDLVLDEYIKKNTNENLKGKERTSIQINNKNNNNNKDAKKKCC